MDYGEFQIRPYKENEIWRHTETEATERREHVEMEHVEMEAKIGMVGLQTKKCLYCQQLTEARRRQGRSVL